MNKIKAYKLFIEKSKSDNAFASLVPGVWSSLFAVTVHLVYYSFSDAQPPDGQEGWGFYLFMFVFMTLFMSGFFYWMMEKGSEFDREYDRVMRIGKIKVDAERERQEQEMKERNQSKYGVRSTRRKHLGLK